MGHDSTQGGAIGDWYDAPQLDEVFMEQAERLPRGPLGLLEPPEVTLVGGIPPAAIALLKEYLAGACGTMDLVNRLEALRLETIAKPI